MPGLKETGSFKGNVGYAIAAQSVSLGSSILMSLVVPKILGVEDYGYWQLFIMLSGYMGMLLFGIHDGVFLRLGGERAERLDCSRVKAEFCLVFVFQVVVALVAIIAVVCSNVDEDRGCVLMLVCLCAILLNPAQFLFYMFRAINLPRIYSNATLISQGLFAVFLLIAAFFQFGEYRAYLIAYVCTQSAAVVLCYYFARSIFVMPTGKIRLAVKDAAEDVKAGMKVTLAYYAGSLVVGVNRLMIDSHWGIEAFGKFSLSISLVNFLIAFTAQVAMVVFPLVKRMGREGNEEAFGLMRRMILLVMPLVYVLYFPCCALLELWLPEYADSLLYLAIILPICVFDCKIQLLVNTYLKAFRKENAMFLINAGCLALSIVLAAVGVYVIGDIYWAACSMVLSIAIRSCVAEAYLSRFIGGPYVRFLASEVMLAVFFVVAAFTLRSPLLTLAAVFAYYVFNAGQVKLFARDAFELVKSRKKF